MEKVVPTPSVELADTAPPIASTRDATMASPSPDPPGTPRRAADPR
jgi:hypothetical protein